MIRFHGNWWIGRETARGQAGDFIFGMTFHCCPWTQFSDRIHSKLRNVCATRDQYFAYQYDAEGRVKYSVSTGQWQYPMYNALGQRVEDYQGPDTLTLTYPVDIFGQRTGAFAQWPSQNWTGWNVYWSQIAGQRLNMGGSDAYIDHSDAVGSTTMETDPAGGVQWDVTHYPWGRVFQETGIRQSEVVMGLDWQVNDPVLPSATREFNFRDRKSTRLNSSHPSISYAVFCLKK